jgi:hypothetical protein
MILNWLADFAAFNGYHVFSYDQLTGYHVSLS